MDCSMPFLDGYDATRAIRKMWEKSGIKREYQPQIVAITGHVEEEFILKAMDSGMNSVFSKPFPLKDFGKLIQRLNFI